MSNSKLKGLLEGKLSISNESEHDDSSGIDVPDTFGAELFSSDTDHKDLDSIEAYEASPVEDTYTDVNEVDVKIDNSFRKIESLESLYNTLEQMIAEDQEIDESCAEIARVTTATILGSENSEAIIPSNESFARDPESSVTASMENILVGIKNIAKKIIQFIKDMISKIYGFLKNLLFRISNFGKRTNDVEGQAKEVFPSNDANMRLEFISSSTEDASGSTAGKVSSKIAESLLVDGKMIQSGKEYCEVLESTIASLKLTVMDRNKIKNLYRFPAAFYGNNKTPNALKSYMNDLMINKVTSLPESKRSDLPSSVINFVKLHETKPMLINRVILAGSYTGQFEEDKVDTMFRASSYIPPALTKTQDISLDGITSIPVLKPDEMLRVIAAVRDLNRYVKEGSARLKETQATAKRVMLDVSDLAKDDYVKPTEVNAIGFAYHRLISIEYKFAQYASSLIGHVLRYTTVCVEARLANQ